MSANRFRQPTTEQKAELAAAFFGGLVIRGRAGRFEDMTLAEQQTALAQWRHDLDQKDAMIPPAVIGAPMREQAPELIAAINQLTQTKFAAFLQKHRRELDLLQYELKCLEERLNVLLDPAALDSEITVGLPGGVKRTITIKTVDHA